MRDLPEFLVNWLIRENVLLIVIENRNESDAVEMLWDLRRVPREEVINGKKEMVALEAGICRNKEY
jgi:hypothetical protein